jgi:hypothetical protein
MESRTLLETLSRLRALPREAATVEFKSNLEEPSQIGQYLSALAKCGGHPSAERGTQNEAVNEMNPDPTPPGGGEFLFYQSDDGRIRLEVRLEGESVWLTQKLMAELFQKDIRTINEHIRTSLGRGNWLRIQLSGNSG